MGTLDIEYGVDEKATYCWLKNKSTAGRFLECVFNISKNNPGSGRALNCDQCRFFVDHEHTFIPSLEDTCRKSRLERAFNHNTAIKEKLITELHNVFDSIHALIEQAEAEMMPFQYNPNFGGNHYGKFRTLQYFLSDDVWAVEQHLADLLGRCSRCGGTISGTAPEKYGVCKCDEDD